MENKEIEEKSGKEHLQNKGKKERNAEIMRGKEE